MNNLSHVPFFNHTDHSYPQLEVDVPATCHQAIDGSVCEATDVELPDASAHSLEQNNWRFKISFYDPLTLSDVSWNICGREQLDRVMARMECRKDHFEVIQGLANEAKKYGRSLVLVGAELQAGPTDVGHTDYLQYTLKDESYTLHLQVPGFSNYRLIVAGDNLKFLIIRLKDWWEHCKYIQNYTISDNFLCGAIACNKEEDRPYVEFLLAIGGQIKLKAVDMVAMTEGSQSQLEEYHAYCSMLALPHYRDAFNKDLKNPSSELWSFVKSHLYTFILYHLLSRPEYARDRERLQNGEESVDSLMVRARLVETDPRNGGIVGLTYDGTCKLLLQEGIFQARI